MADTDEHVPLWTPSAERLAAARMTRFMDWAGARHGREFADYDELWRWSVSEVEQFWADVWEYCGVRASAPYERVLSAPRGTDGSSTGSPEMPGARWFEGAMLNYAENLLCRVLDAPGLREDERSEARAERTAVVHASELRPPIVDRHSIRGTQQGGRSDNELSWSELTEQVAAAAAGLRSLGVRRGDRVAAYMPNIPETLVAFLASASIGAIWSCAAPEFGARSVIDRFAQIEPKILLVVDGYRHGGKDFDRTEALETILGGLPSVQHTVLLPYLDRSARASRLRAGLSWDDLLQRGEGAELRFEQVPFDHPLWVLYSSGTTGLPKAIVHGHGGILLEQLKKSMLHLDLRPGDRMFWFTTTGWMMWNFLVGCLFGEAAIVLYDGSPAYPDLGRLWQLAEQTGITCMGVSAGLLSGCEKARIEPAREYDLSRLQSIGSTGSPLPPEGFRWVYEHVGPDIWLFSTSGGTDVCTAFVGGCPLLPVYAGELQCRVLGCAVESWDEQGRPLQDALGELVLTRPLPSMPLFLWGDESGERYRESYFDMYSGIWRHGDWIRITPRGGTVIYGRSDSTINRQGVRMGTSEIYRATSAVPEVADALVIDVPSGEAGELLMVLFVVLRDGLRLDDDLRGRIKARVREYCSPRHVPDKILQIQEVPRTLSGKALEVPIKRILMGAAPSEAASVESLANPRALDYFVELARRCRAASAAVGS